MRRGITTQRLGSFVLCGALSFLALAPFASVARAQAAPAVAAEDARVVERILAEGEELERARRWGDAFGHYEEALKRYPDRTDFQQRLTLSRLHLDVCRRYADQNFVRAVGEMSTAEAMELYGEVLLKIHTHYVESPQWTELVRRGLASLDVALTEPDFTGSRLQRASAEQLAAFRASLPTMIEGRQLQTRTEAQQMAADVAYQAAQSLGMTEPAVILEFTCGAAAALDQYSSFLTATQLEDVFSQIEGNFVGLGVELKTVDKALEIVGVIEGSPAAAGGIAVGDRIVGVDGITTEQKSADELADMLKGPEGSTVNVTVLDAQGQQRQVRIVRQRVDVPSVDRVQMLEGNVGYFRITSFQKTTSRDVDAALWKLHREGMKFLIVDVRGNPGGLLTASVEVADKFLMEGKIVSTRGRAAHEDFDYRAHAVGTWRTPMAVLIDGDSASASEIFAGAIHDHQRGTIVGSQSYGKGSVQGIFPLPGSKSGIRLTTAKFFSPSGQAISDRGVTPNLEVHAVAKPVVGDGENAQPVDPVLQAGLQLAQSQLSSR